MVPLKTTGQNASYLTFGMGIKSTDLENKVTSFKSPPDIFVERNIYSCQKTTLKHVFFAVMYLHGDGASHR